MNDQFKLPNENKGSDDSARRVSDLIEEIRADIDFELDDAVTDIVRDLPDEYFQRMNHENQVTHLKGLIASRICQLNGELFLPASDGSQVAVIGRNNHRGQLANILSELPGKKTRLVGANIYTARSHGFILDVFEFETDQQPAVDASFSAEVIEKLCHKTGSDNNTVSEFLSRIRTTSAKSPDLEKLSRFFLVYQQVNPENPVVVERGECSSDMMNVVVAVHAQDERATFQLTTEMIATVLLYTQHSGQLQSYSLSDRGQKFQQYTDTSIIIISLASSTKDGPC